MSTQCSLVCAEHPWRGTLRALLLQAEQSLDRRQLHLFAVDRRPSQVRSHQLIPAIAHLLFSSTSPASQLLDSCKLRQWLIYHISNPFYGKAEGLQSLQTLPAFVSGPDSGALPSGPLDLEAMRPCCLTNLHSDTQPTKQPNNKQQTTSQQQTTTNNQRLHRCCQGFVVGSCKHGRSKGASRPRLWEHRRLQRLLSWLTIGVRESHF